MPVRTKTLEGIELAHGIMVQWGCYQRQLPDPTPRAASVHRSNDKPTEGFSEPEALLAEQIINDVCTERDRQVLIGEFIYQRTADEMLHHLSATGFQCSDRRTYYRWKAEALARIDGAARMYLRYNKAA